MRWWAEPFGNSPGLTGRWLVNRLSCGVEKGRDINHLSEQYKREKEKAKVLAQSEAINLADAARLTREYPWLLT